MKVRIKKQGGLAIDCRTNVYFNIDDVFAVGDQRFSEENLTELVALGLAEEIAEEDSTEVPSIEGSDQEPSDSPDEPEEAAESVEPEEAAEPKYQSFTKKADLEEYAKETYSIDLDRRLTLKGMIEQLENELGGEL